MFLIDDLLFWLPLKGMTALGQKIDELARQELHGEPARLREELLRLQTQFALDEISEAEYNEREEELLKKLQALRGATS